LLDHDRGRPSPFKHLPTSRNLLSGKRYESVVLPVGWSCVRNGPVDGAAVRQNPQRGTSLFTRRGPLSADRFLQTLGECASRIQHVALNSSRLAGVVTPG